LLLKCNEFFIVSRLTISFLYGFNMKIISTNISKVKTVMYNGKEVKTGIFKVPTNDDVVIQTLNIVGDEQADLINHGGEHIPVTIQDAGF
jgi:MOSC domain-containing protein YiiM